MKTKKVYKFFSAFGILFCTVACVVTITCQNNASPLYAHDSQLMVTYDECSPTPYVNSNNIGDGKNEKWYELIQDNTTCHFPSSADIKYHLNDSEVWDEITDLEQREHVEHSILLGINKWNKVCFYKYLVNNAFSKERLVRVYKGSVSNNNLLIYPVNLSSYPDAITCSDSYSSTLIDSQGGINHYHCDEWCIEFNIRPHLVQSNNSEILLSYISAHELGHTLGLRDIDSCENGFNMNSYHHEELLMGYSKGENTQSHRQTEITYKDLAGVAITRGFHTDNDHKWMYDADSSNSGNYKLICSICNGVIYVNSLNGYNYVTYKYCNNNHSVSSGNMFAVASYEDKDYYKCKYCRYVAPFEDNISQDYLYTYVNSSTHHVANQVNGLNYSFNESHLFSHHFVNYSSTKHKAYCVCGHYELASHAADGSSIYVYNGHIYATCLFCNALLDLSGNDPIIPSPGSLTQMVTDNGSYILPNGIYVIVEDDLEAFLDGLLIFHMIGDIAE